MKRTVDWIHKKGTTFLEQIFQYKENGVPRSLVDAEILIQLRKEPNGVVVYTLLYTITDADEGIFKIDEQIININPCTYLYDIRIIFSDNEVQADVEGKFIITPNISQNV